jgi:glycolate oxidase iron-sulfur subunit
MQTQFTERLKYSTVGKEADDILRRCVHCGFCNATCPTYQLLGDELDGPRGRIYLIKQVLEGQAITRKTQQHLDRCLTCRSCETTCPSGVHYGRLAEIGRELVGQQVAHRFPERLLRRVLRWVIPYPRRFALLYNIARKLQPILPTVLANKIPQYHDKQPRPTHAHSRRMLILEGCVQSVTTPATNSATVQVLDKLGIEVVSVPTAGCCGAMSLHLNAQEEARRFMRRNIDAWWPSIENGIEAIIMTASGCGAVVKEYGMHLQQDTEYAKKAVQISRLTRDLSEVVAQEDISGIKVTPSTRVAFHAPCTLQHAQQITGKVEAILQRAGYELTTVADTHLCCGSAGTYSILQPGLAHRLLRNKLTALNAQRPDIIATANIGCQLQLATAATVPVKHWIELLHVE